MKARKPIRPKMQGTEKLVDTRGTKFGLSDAAARQQVDTIFGAVSKGRHGANNGALADQDKVIQKKYYSEEKLLKPGSMKSGKTQQLRWANNHGSASKVVLSACDRGVLLCGAGASRLRQGRALVRVVTRTHGSSREAAMITHTNAISHTHPYAETFNTSA